MRLGLSWVYGRMVWSSPDGQEWVDDFLAGRLREAKARKAQQRLAAMAGAN